jgi:hypothetical protein
MYAPPKILNDPLFEPFSFQNVLNFVESSFFKVDTGLCLAFCSQTDGQPT